MGWLSDIFNEVVSWFSPDVSNVATGASGVELTKPNSNGYEAVIYGELGKVSGIVQHQATNDGDDDDIENDLLHLIVTWGESVSAIVDVTVDDI